MADEQGQGSFMLLTSSAEIDQVRGDLDLFAVHGLTRVAEVMLSGNSNIENYAGGLKHYAGLRKGQNMELAPLADLYPSSIQPDFAPLSAQTLSAGLTLEPGKYSLQEADLGIPVDSRALLGEEKPPQREQTAPTAPPATAPRPTKIKLKPLMKKS